MKLNNQPTDEVQNQIELEITGMTCQSCAAHVVQTLKEVEGMAAAHIPDWHSGRAAITVHTAVSDKLLVEAVEQAGYEAAVVPPRTVTVSQPPTRNGDNVAPS